MLFLFRDAAQRGQRIRSSWVEIGTEELSAWVENYRTHTQIHSEFSTHAEMAALHSNLDLVILKPNKYTEYLIHILTTLTTLTGCNFKTLYIYSAALLFSNFSGIFRIVL